jgi:hypothetical protein
VVLAGAGERVEDRRGPAAPVTSEEGPTTALGTHRPPRSPRPPSRQGQPRVADPSAEGPFSRATVRPVAVRTGTVHPSPFGRRSTLVASFWSSNSDFGLDFLDFEMTSRP